MRPYSLEEIARVVGGKVVHGDPGRRYSSVSTDSRRVRQGDLFVALAGERSDGHDFVAEASRKGAGGALIERLVDGLSQQGDADGRAFDASFGAVLVPSTVKALQSLASAYRSELGATVIGITGSVGKTSTKDMLCSVLSTTFPTYGNAGNLNSHIGLPLAVLAIDGNPRFAVLEMAMRARGEIGELCAIARPSIGVLTDISHSHVGILGSIEEIALAKAELLESLPPHGVAVLSGDNDWVRKVSSRAKCPVVFYGLSDGCHVRAVDVSVMGASGSRFRVKVSGIPALPDSGTSPAAVDPSAEFRLRAPGLHQVHNALAAIAVGIVAGVPQDKIRSGLENATLSPMRLDVFTVAGVTVINDAYNASPKSMKAALDLLESVEGKRKVAVLGDMLEMGEYGLPAHREVGRYAAAKADLLLCSGDLSREIKAGFDAETSGRKDASWFPDKSLLQARMLEVVGEGDVVLVKASRAMGFESVVAALKEMRPND